jgi:hypothetical protein
MNSSFTKNEIALPSQRYGFSSSLDNWCEEIKESLWNLLSTLTSFLNLWKIAYSGMQISWGFRAIVTSNKLLS